MKKILITTLLLFITTTAFADLTIKLSSLIGYTIVGRKTIIGWYDQEGKKGSSFEGCEFGRIIIFNNHKTLRCEGYGYQYDYMPTAILLSNGSSVKMIVGDEVYDML